MSLRFLYNDTTGTTFNLIILGITTIGDTYYMDFENELTDVSTGITLTDTSSYPDTYSTFEIMISGLTLSEGWYRYRIYTDDTKTDLLKYGQCYCYDTEGKVENSPDDVSYTETKNKYVYKK